MGSHTERGIIVDIGKEERKSDKLTIQTLVIRTADQYPQYLSFETINDRCNLLKKLMVNQVVTVHFDMKGREWKSPDGRIKYMQSNQIWKIEPDLPENSEQDHEETLKELGFDNNPQVQQQPYNGKIDDLPF